MVVQLPEACGNEPESRLSRGLNLEPHAMLLAQLVGAFASELHSALQAPLAVPSLSARSQEEESWEEGKGPACPALGDLSSVVPAGFLWPQLLHMTTFFLGGSRTVLEALQHSGVDVAMQLQGSTWQLQGGHLVYAEDALLALTLHVGSDSLPMDPACLPHTTLLFKPPFTPAHANEVLRAALFAGLLADAPCEGSGESAVFAVPAVEVAGRTLTLYAQRVPATVVFGACLDSFWASRIR